jgi:hypothetical protein
VELDSHYGFPYENFVRVQRKAFRKWGDGATTLSVGVPVGLYNIYLYSILQAMGQIP